MNEAELSPNDSEAPAERLSSRPMIPKRPLTGSIP